MGLIRKEDLHSSCEEYIGKLHSNPNLLINGDFQVWQRGLGKNGNNYFDCTNSNKYTADRFMVSGEQGTRLTVEKQKGSGMKLIFNDHTLNTSNIRTYFDRDDILRMVGKTYTFSVEYQYEYNNPWSNDFHLFSYPDNSVSYSVIKSKKIEVGLKQIRLEITFKIDSISDETTKMHIQWLRSRDDVDGFGYHIIKYIKLEEGTIATPFVPRPYREELDLCLRYYYRAKISQNLIASDDKQILVNINTPKIMRINPTAIYDTDVYFHNLSDGNPILIGNKGDHPQRIDEYINDCNLKVWLCNSNSSTQITSGMCGVINDSNSNNNRLTSSAIIIFDAEIY